MDYFFNTISDKVLELNLGPTFANLGLLANLAQLTESIHSSLNGVVAGENFQFTYYS
jgi:hypothetical protein